MSALLTYDDVADRLKISRRKVEALRADGLLRPILIGRLVRFSELELERYIATTSSDGAALPRRRIGRGVARPSIAAAIARAEET